MYPSSDAGSTRCANALRERLPFAHYGAVDQEHASARLDDIVETDVDAARPGDPVQFGVKQPEVRRAPARTPAWNSRTSRRSGRNDRASGPSSRPPRTPAGTPSATPMIVATVASSSVAGKKCMRSERTGLEVMTEWPKSPVSTRSGRGDIAPALDRSRPISRANAIVRLPRRVIADDGQHRIDGDEPSYFEKVTAVSPRKVAIREPIKPKTRMRAASVSCLSRQRCSRATASRSWPQLWSVVTDGASDVRLVAGEPLPNQMLMRGYRRSRRFLGDDFDFVVPPAIAIASRRRWGRGARGQSCRRRS